jgi:hypothetical protein
MVVHRSQIDLRRFGDHPERNAVIRVLGKQLFSGVENALCGGEGIAGNSFNETNV